MGYWPPRHANPRHPVLIVDRGDLREAIELGSDDPAGMPRHGDSDSVPVGLLPPVFPESLGSPIFRERCGTRFAYVVGEMAQAIATVEMVAAGVRSGFMAFFGSAGLKPAEIREAVAAIAGLVGLDTSWGVNLIHIPEDVGAEHRVIDVLLEAGVRNVSASAFMRLTPATVRFAAKGLVRRADGTVDRRTHVFAKISRPEVASAFLVPPPPDMLRDLVAAGQIDEVQAELQAGLPVAEFVTVEADSGGHTDNRPATCLFPVLACLRDEVVARYRYDRPILLGLAGGLGVPEAVASAFALGADYVVTGSVNQSARESGLSPLGRSMLAEAGIADVVMAPAADMFELGAKVQVLRRGTMFGARAQRLYNLYTRYNALEELPERDLKWLESQLLEMSCEEAWALTRHYINTTNPELVAKAENSPKVRMALVFRRYLFLGADWARKGEADRRADFQIWCGPAMGAFNAWVKDSTLQDPEERTVEQIGLNLLEGAAHIARAQQLRAAGVKLAGDAFQFRPRQLSVI